MPHLLIAISSHGFGHAAQTAPVVNALRQRIPDLRVTLRTTVPPALLAARFEGEFTHVPVASDFGMRMASAVGVLVDESARAYAEFHRHWEGRVREEAQALAALAPDLVLANVPYLTLAGAAEAGIPAVALCSLNWADVYAHYCGQRPEAAEIHAQMLAAYNSAGNSVGNSAACFLQTEPHMPMTDIARRRSIGPVARIGHTRRAEINRRLGLSERDRLVLIAPGGIEMRLPINDWPRSPRIRWLVAEAWRVTHPDAVSIESLSMHFMDILCSSDALIGKPGYGSFTEVACNAVPMLYVKRHDWPEEPYLVEWLDRNGRSLEIGRAQLERGDIFDALQTLWAMPARPPVAPAGVRQAVDYLADVLSALPVR
ncbi:MAG: hypothetical protein O2845_02500 [Proteobacteria bacterium]|nr:hypothetical protein [Pseudomonadota bacterium]